MRDVLSAVMDDLLQPFGEFHLQGGPLLQVADEVLHVPGHVFCILQRSVHTSLAALEKHVHLLGGQATFFTVLHAVWGPLTA